MENLNKGIAGCKRLILILLFISLLPITSFAQSNFILSPPIIDIAIPPGGMKDFTLIVLNNSGEEGTFKVYPTDILISPSSLKFPDAGTSKYSCAKWIELSETIFVIGPKESKEIQGRITVPRRESGGRYATVMCQRIEDDLKVKKEEMISIKPIFRLGTIIKLAIKGGRAKIKGKIEDVFIEELQKGGLEVRALFLNEGNIHTLGKGRFMIRDTEKRIKARGFFPEATTFPESQSEFKYHLGRGLPKGRYIIEASIIYGKGRRTFFKKEFNLEETTEKDASGEELINLSLDPPILDKFLRGGSFKYYPITVHNGEPYKAEIKVDLSDFHIGEDGGVEYLDEGSTNHSCADWVEVKPDEFELEPGTSKKIRVTVNPPKKIKKVGFVRLVFMINLYENFELLKTGSKYLTIIASTIKDIKEEGEIIEFNASSRKEEGVEFGVRLKNSGESLLSPVISFKIFDKELNEITKGRFQEERLILPGGISDIKHTHTISLEKGKYIAMVNVKYGKDKKSLSAKKALEIR